MYVLPAWSLRSGPPDDFRGFDAHREDPLAYKSDPKGLYGHGGLLGSFAKDFGRSRIITVLEGGDNLAAPEECVSDDIKMLQSL